MCTVNYQLPTSEVGPPEGKLEVGLGGVTEQQGGHLDCLSSLARV